MFRHSARTALRATCLLWGGICVSASPGWAQEARQDRILVTIPNMHCEGCAKKIRSRLFAVPGVAKVSTTLSRNLAEIEPSPGRTVSVFEVWDSLEKAKFEPSKIISPEGEFDEKPPKPA